MQVVDVPHGPGERRRHTSVDVEFVEGILKASGACSSEFKVLPKLLLSLRKFLEGQKVRKQMILVDLLEILNHG